MFSNVNSVIAQIKVVLANHIMLLFDKIFLLSISDV